MTEDLQIGSTEFNGVVVTPLNFPRYTTERVDFNESEFDLIIEQKGRKVLVEKSSPCPCKGSSSDNLSDCKNCGGSGIFFFSKEMTRMVIQNMGVTVDFKQWSQETRGMVNISCKNKEKITFMDRITILDGESTFQEVLHFKKLNSLVDGKLFAYTSYLVKNVVYCSMFINVDTQLRLLVKGVDYTIENNKLILDSQYTDINTSITIRYTHCPTFYVIEMRRETMDSYKIEGGKEKEIRLPISAIGRRAHYIINAENLTADRILNNIVTINENNCDS